MSARLPLNRKERFYTGTVLPMIACSQDFAQFWRLTKLMGAGEVHVDPDPASANFQFFTEYGFAESAITPAAKKLFPAGFPSKETPDLLIYVNGSPSRLLAIEAKMYHRPLKETLIQQIHRQQVLLEHLRTSLVVKAGHVFHAALLPEPFAKEVGKLPVPTITWESVLAAYKDDGPAYFLEVLRLALRGYGELKSKSSAAWGLNMEAKVSGAEIYERYHDATLEYPYMGRSGGLTGSKLSQDIEAGTWKSRAYEVRSQPLPSNPNWFSVADLVALIDQPPGVGEGRPTGAAIEAP